MISYPVMPRPGRPALVLAQIFLNTGAAKSFGDFSSPATEVTLGIKYLVASRTAIEFGLIENVFTFDNSPGFGIQASLRSVNRSGRECASALRNGRASLARVTQPRRITSRRHLIQEGRGP